jgi:hypothetical protein
MRALDFEWIEASSDDERAAELKAAWRIQVRREGETKWTTIPAIKVAGPPEDVKQ